MRSKVLVKKKALKCDEMGNLNASLQHVAICIEKRIVHAAVEIKKVKTKDRYWG